MFFEFVFASDGSQAQSVVFVSMVVHLGVASIHHFYIHKTRSW